MKLLYTFVFAIFAVATFAQKLTYETYIDRVRENNIGYIAEKYNIDIADANIQAAKVFNDPELSFSYSNNQDKKMKMGQSYEGALGYSFSLGNVRGARIGVARAEKDLADASLADYFRNLKADASICYYDALKQKENVELVKSSYEQMQLLAKSDSVMFSLGEVPETDVIQTRLEAEKMYNEYLQAEADYRNALAKLSILMGDKEFSQINNLADSLTFSENIYSLGELFEQAEDNRADLQVALYSKTLSEKNLRLVKANRAMELGLNFGFAHNTIVENEIAPAPAHNSVSIGFSIPLKFSNSNRGEVNAAKFAVKQSEANIEAARLQIRNEVIQAYNNYITSAEIAKNFSMSMIDEASRILKDKTFGYRHGETSLLEVLDAQRTYNEVCRSYNEAVCNASIAKIELERAVGR